MVTITHELGKKNGKGRTPIYIRVCQNRQYRRIRFYVDAEPADLTAKGDIKNQRLYLALQDQMQDYRRKLIEIGPTLTSWDVDRVCAYLTESDKVVSQADEVFRLDFIDYGRKLAAGMMETRNKTARSYITSLNTFAKFLGKDSVDINDINKAMLQRYIDWFKENGYKSRAIELYMSNLQSIHNKAKAQFNDEEDDKLNIRLSPFKHVVFKRTAAEKSMVGKRAISPVALRYLYELPTDGMRDLVRMARDAFFLSFGLCGMNAIDMYKHVQGDIRDKSVIEYYRSKIVAHSGENAFIRMHVHPFFAGMHERLKGKRHTWCFAERYSSTDNMNHALNEGIRACVDACVEYYGEKWGMDTERQRKAILNKLELPEHLQFYAARHSFATIAANDCGVPEDIVNRCQAHVSQTMAARAYIKKDYRFTDETIAKVVDCVFGSVSH